LYILFYINFAAIKPNIADISAISSTHVDETCMSRFPDLSSTTAAFDNLDLTCARTKPFLRGCRAFVSRGITGELLQKCLMVLENGEAYV
jgi:hypothetical protein